MNLRPILLLCATFATLAPCYAQSASPALKARLRAQIRELSPQLTVHSANGDDELALPLAQLGDLAGANRLASTQFTRDGIAQWRAQQRAMRGDWRGASVLAASVRAAAIRADAYLVIARLASDKGDFSAARPALTRAMDALDQTPDAAPLAYAGWLWWRLGDVAAARRVLLDKAWPAALREDERHARQFQRESTVFPASQRRIVTQFAARCGLLREILQNVDPDNALPTQWLLQNADTPDDLQFLSQRALATETDPVGLYLLAVVLARHQQFERARQLRARARDLSAQRAPDANFGFPSYLQLLLALELGEDETYQTIARDWTRRSHGERAPANVAVLPQLSRVFAIADSPTDARDYRFRKTATRADIDAYADALLTSPSAIDSRSLAALLDYYGPRDATRVRALAAALEAKITAHAREIEAGRARGAHSSWSPAAAIAAQLRDLGYAEQSAALRETLIQRTPTIFRPTQAQDFLRHGFDQAAHSTFDPLRFFASQARLPANAPPNPRFTFDWGAYAQTQARYQAPDAPMRWFGALETPAGRAHVVKNWIDGLTPQLQLSPSYVKRTIDIRQGYGVSGSGRY